MSSFDFSKSINFIDKLKTITPEEISNDPLIRSKLNKIKLQATMPFCAEQIILILTEILSLIHDYKFTRLTSDLKFDEPANISIFVSSILPLLKREHDGELINKLEKSINEFNISGGSEKAFYEEIKVLRNKFISCIDVDFVMQTAAHTNKSKETLGKDAILVVGKTGAGKSFVINYMCCEEMFSRSSKLFGHKLTIHHDRQPAFLKHIKIGQSAVSETSKMGVVDISKSKFPWINKFSGNKYVICDTPGAGDNRSLLGPELKLANSLETIVPMYKANSVRFLVVISSKATSARGEEFKETIKFVSKMFGSVDDLISAANSMVFAINGEDGDKNLAEFKQQLDNFYESRYSLGLDENDVELIKILQKKFKSNEVYLIQPGKDVSIKPEELMKKLDACQPMKPTILTPFAESSIKDLLEQESNLLTQSIDKIFGSLEDNVSNEVLQIQVQRLALKLAKLSFMDAYYSINQSNILPYFKKLAGLINRLQSQLLSSLCPQKGGIESSTIDVAIEALERLRELDQMVSMMINGLFSDNRDHVISLIAAFDSSIKLPFNYKKINDREWFEWVEKNRPQSAAKKVENEIKKFRVTLTNKLTGLINIQLVQIHAQQVQSLALLQNAGAQTVTHAKMDRLDRKHQVFSQYVASDLSNVIHNRSDFNLEQYVAEVAEKLKKEISLYAPDDSDPLISLYDVVRSLQVQDAHLKDLFTNDSHSSLSVQSEPTSLEPSAPALDDSNEKDEKSVLSSPDILRTNYTHFTQKLIECAITANLNHDFTVTVNAIEMLDKVVELFGFTPPEELAELKKAFKDFFTDFISSAKQLIQNDNQPLNADDIQSLLLNFSIITNVRNIKAFSKYIDSSLYPSSIQLELDSLASELSSRFTITRQKISYICNQVYTKEYFSTLDTELQQLWYVLSLPSDSHAQLTSEYVEIVTNISEYCMKISGELSGKLQIDTTLGQDLYKKIKGYLEQLKSLPMVTVLNLGQAEKNLKDALNLRALHLIDRTDKVDLSLAYGDNITSHADLIQEIESLEKEFSEYLPQSTLTKIQKALVAYHARISATLCDITDQIKNRKIDKNAEVPVQFFTQSNNYLHDCQKMGMSTTEVAALQEDLVKDIQYYAAVQKLSVDEKLRDLAPTAMTADAAPEVITSILTQYEQLQKNIPELYAACDNPIEVWTGQLYDLALQYQTALTEALQTIMAGHIGNHEKLLKRVSEFEVFDGYIKQHIHSEEKPITFKKLYKRFENAFKIEHFTKLKRVMLAVFNGDFETAQRLAIEDKELALGTDMRLVLTDQIGTYISASISTIERGLTQLKLATINPSSMNELMQSYARVNSAQRLVDAGLLSDKLLTKRDQLLLATQSALDAWLIDVIAKIDGHINQLDFKSTHSQLNDLRMMLESMQVKPNNSAHLLNQVTNRFHAKITQCFDQYKQPLISWSKHAYSLADVAAAFSAVKELSYDEKSFGEYWIEISTQVWKTLDKRCAGIENQFSKNEISVEEAVSALEEIALIVKDVPHEHTDLHVKVKERYQKTVAQIQKDIVESKIDDERHKKIQSLLAASEKFAKSLGTCDFATAYSYLSNTANSLKSSILAQFEKGTFPLQELVYFANLHRIFSSKLDLLQTDCDLYAGKLNVLVKKALDDIKSGSSLYGSGTDQTAALNQIHSALTQLIEVQSLSTETKGMAALVDANLPNRVVELLLEVKQLLMANNDKFKTALAARNIADLDQTLVVAHAFQDVTLSIERYINACSMTSLPEEFQLLKQLNNDFSYVGLRNLIIAELKSIRSELEALDPLTLKAEGSAIRETFYANLRRDIEFIQKIPALTKHIDNQLLEQKAIANDYGLEQCLSSISAFLEKTFRLAFHQLKIVTTPNVTNSWVEFNRYFQEILIFVEQCSSVACLSGLKIPKKMLLNDDSNDSLSLLSPLSKLIDTSLVSGASSTTIEASLLAQFLNEMFIVYFRDLLISFKETFKTSTSDETDQQLVALLAGLQKMAEDMPVLADAIKVELKKFLKDLQGMRSESYMSFLAVQLRNEEKGFGARMVAEQPVFAGIMTAERNTLTMKQDIDYVLKRMEVQDKNTRAIRSLTSTEIMQLREQYVQFDEAYNHLINTYISEQKNFAKYSKVHLEELKQALLALIDDNKPDRDMNGHIIWNEKITKLIPHLYAYLFTIWTLKESPAFFDSTNTDSNINFLKKPHPAQMVAIFQMLNTIDAKADGLPNVLDELLTGQGKSVVLASTASLLALLGFAVDVGCYSEYLSGRDEKAFKWLIDFLNVSAFIQYGTFNRLSEDMLNRDGDLRDLVSNALFGTTIPIKPKAHHGRETIALVDEVDSLVTAFFGHLYQPYFLLTGEHVNALLNAIWVRHENGKMQTLRDLQNLPEYTACLKHFKGCEYIIKQAAREMFEDLQKYKYEQGHDFHVNSDGELYYKHFDGTTMAKSIGYRTYWACRDKANNVSKTCREKHEGIKITCGAYSYVDLMRNAAAYRAMLGVTGTYRELSKAEKYVVENVFGIKGASFIPSAYGENKLKFNPGNQFTVVDDDEYNLRLYERIAKNKLGWVNEKSIRPVLVFFETEEDLEAFYNSEAFKGYKSMGVNIMSSKTITSPSERDTLISQATRANTITLAVGEHGRGNDFILTHPTVIANGGMSVIDGYMPETEAEQRQHQGRGARQGQDGSFDMVIKKSEIIKKFGLVEKQIEDARRAGNLYEVVSAARNKKFSDGYQKLVDESAELLEKIHKPSMKLLDVLHRNTDSSTNLTKEIIDAHMQTLPGGKVKVEVKELREAKVLILFDSTGSMSSLINALKDTLADVVENLGYVLREVNATFQLQLAHYEDYDSGPDEALHCTNEWSCDPAKLKQFISNVNAHGGGSNNSECVELGLFHANQLAKDGLNHVILIGDEPPSSESEMLELRKKYAPSSLKSGAFVEARHYLKESEELAKKHIPVSTFFTRTTMFYSLKDDKTGQYLTEKAFKEIADKTGGEAGELHLEEKATAINEVTSLFAKKIIGTVVQDSDNQLADELYDKFKQRMQQYSRH